VVGLLPAVSALDLGTARLYPEVAVIAFHFHWGRDECLGMSRRERRAWIDEIGRINAEIAKAMKVRKPSRGGRR
jgi:hypothetical protein